MTSLLLRLLLFVQVPAGIQGQTGVVTGVLRTETGLPLSGVRVAVTPANQSIADSLLESLGLTDNTGRYRLENVSPGRYNLLVGRGTQSKYHPGVTELDKATTIQVLAGSTTEVPDMVFGGNYVMGRVIDLATGKVRHIESLVLCCDYSHSVLAANPDRPGQIFAFNANTSDDGSFVFPSVPAGNYFLSADDRSVLPVSLVLAVESHVSGLELAVSEGVEVQGKVLDQTGQPVTAPVRLRPNPTNPAINTMSPPTNTSVSASLFVPKGSSLEVFRDRLVKAAREQSDTPKPDGTFAFQKVYPGAYVLEVNARGVSLLERKIQVGASGLTNVSLQVQAINVSGRVIAHAGGTLPKLNYVRLVRSGAEADVFYGFPDPEGHFSLVLVPGVYRVFTERLGPPVQSVSDGSRDITNGEFSVEGTGNPQIVITLEP